MQDERSQLLDVLAAVVRDRLIEGHRVTLPGLGVLSVRHVPSKVIADDDGENFMIPPRDVVDFDPEL
ncbi:MAG: HU family DNA-binding protein [Rhodothermales bacterium]|nr:HU family DNA-binding protein [Rhodothermales bacterium]